MGAVNEQLTGYFIYTEDLKSVSKCDQEYSNVTRRDIL